MDLAFAAEQYAQAQSVAAAVAQYYANAANAAAMNAINAAAEQGHQVQVISKRFSNVLYDIFGNKTTRSYFWAVTNPVIFGKKTTQLVFSIRKTKNPRHHSSLKICFHLKI